MRLAGKAALASSDPAVIVAFLQANLHDVSIQTDACTAVYELMKAKAANKAVAADAGLGLALVTALRTHARAASVQVWACVALEWMLPHGVLHVVAAGGRAAVVAAQDQAINGADNRERVTRILVHIAGVCVSPVLHSRGACCRVSHGVRVCVPLVSQRAKNSWRRCPNPSCSRHTAATWR